MLLENDYGFSGKQSKDKEIEPPVTGKRRNSNTETYPETGRTVKNFEQREELPRIRISRGRNRKKHKTPIRSNFTLDMGARDRLGMQTKNYDGENSPERGSNKTFDYDRRGINDAKPKGVKRFEPDGSQVMYRLPKRHESPDRYNEEKSKILNDERKRTSRRLLDSLNI